MDSIENIGNDNYHGLVVNNHGKYALAETAKWAKFLSILGFIFIGLLVFLGIFMSFFLGKMGGMGELGMAGAGLGASMMIIYIIIGAIYVYPTLKLYNFSKKVKDAIKSDDPTLLAEAFQEHKSVYKFMGIFMIIILAFYAIALLFLGGAAAFM